jgi:cellulose synthase/poly-beta-1,6-N-acetylglucosamine synthase-like glycosyltransferase
MGMLLQGIDVIAALCIVVQFAPAAYYVWLIHRLWSLPEAAASPGLPATDLPPVLIQIPVYNEPLVVERALASAGGLDWPRERFTIQLLDDSTDRTSDIAGPVVARLRQQGINAVHVRRAGRGGFKAGALEAGMALCDAPFIAVFDADFVAPSHWLRQAMAALLANPQAAFVQTRIEWGNGARNWLTRAQRLMQDAHFAVEQECRARRGLPFQFNGTGGIWRRAAVDAAGGWSHDTLSEDLDLVLRAYLKGWTGVFTMEPHVVGELPQQLADFGAQQSRWSKGFVQVARKLLPQIWTARWTGEAKLLTTLALTQQLTFPALTVGVLADLPGLMFRAVQS